MNILGMLGVDENMIDDFKKLLTEYDARQKRIEEKLDKLLEKTEEKEHE